MMKCVDPPSTEWGKKLNTKYSLQEIFYDTDSSSSDGSDSDGGDSGGGDSDGAGDSDDNATSSMQSWWIDEHGDRVDHGK